MTIRETNQVDMSYEAQERKLSAQSSAFLSLLTKRGLIQDTKIDNERIRKASQERNLAMYHNTLMLLKNYQHISWILECAPSEIAMDLALPYSELDSLLNTVAQEIGSDQNAELEWRLRSLSKSKMLVNHLNEALTVLRRKPGDGELLYKVVFYSFIDRERRTIEELTDFLHISCRQYYRLRQRAINLLSIRLWSAPSGDMDDWLEIMAVLKTVYQT